MAQGLRRGGAMNTTLPCRLSTVLPIAAFIFTTAANAEDFPPSPSANETPEHATSTPWAKDGPVNAQVLFREDMRKLRTSNYAAAGITAAAGVGVFGANAFIEKKGIGAGVADLLLTTTGGYFLGASVGSLLFATLPPPESRSHARTQSTTLIVTGSTLGAVGLAGVGFGATRVGRSGEEGTTRGILLVGGSVLGLGTSLILNGIFERNAAVRFEPWSTAEGGGARLSGTF